MAACRTLPKFGLSRIAFATSRTGHLCTSQHARAGHHCRSISRSLAGGRPGQVSVAHRSTHICNDRRVSISFYQHQLLLRLRRVLNSGCCCCPCRAIGKLYHPNSPKNEDNPLSWSITYPEDVGGGCSCTPMQNYCRLPENTTCYDVALTDMVIRDLHEHQTNNSISSKPFFLGLVSSSTMPTVDH